MSQLRRVVLGQIYKRWRGSVERTKPEGLWLRLTVEIGRDPGAESACLVDWKAFPAGRKVVDGQKVVVTVRRIKIDGDAALLTTYQVQPLRKLSKAYCNRLKKKLDALAEKYPELKTPALPEVGSTHA